MDLKKIITTLFISTIIATIAICFNDIVETAKAAPISRTDSVTHDNRDDTDAGSEISHVTLNGDSITSTGGGAIVDGRTITINSAGKYIISGTLDDGQIIVNSEDDKKVKLVLNSVDIACSTSAPLHVINAKKTEISLVEDTANYITDGDSYVFDNAESDGPKAAIFSNSDLTIKGKGFLSVNANYNNGIQSKDDIRITGGNITVNAANNGIKGRDSIAIKKKAIVEVKAGGDGLQSTNDEDPEKGYISIENGTINITAVQDGIQAESDLNINGGEITISSGGGSANSATRMDNRWDKGRARGNRGVMQNANDGSDSISAKGLKAGAELTISGGTIHIDSSDDSLHSNNGITIDGGNIVLAAGDDGIRSTSNLEINGGNIEITKSYEGIESAIITINDGNINLFSTDDGMNVVGADSGMFMGPRDRVFEGNGNSYLNINGGYVSIDAGGDGLDINGPIDMSGGVVIVNGPTSNWDGPLDYFGHFNITGGVLVAAGSSGMAEAPSTSSTQYSFMINFSSALPGGTIFHIESEDGKEIITFAPTKTYQSVVICSPDMEKDSTYLVYTGGSLADTGTDILSSGGTYAGGTQITRFTASNTVTYEGSYGGGFSRRGRR